MNDPSNTPASFQFSIRHELFVTTLIAAALVALTATPTAGTCLLLMVLAVVFTTVAIVASVQTTGLVRSFWIGFAVAIGFAGAGSITAPVMLQFSYAVRIEEYVSKINGIRWCLAPVNGLLAAAVHRIFLPPKSGD